MEEYIDAIKMSSGYETPYYLELGDMNTYTYQGDAVKIQQALYPLFIENTKEAEEIFIVMQARMEHNML